MKNLNCAALVVKWDRGGDTRHCPNNQTAWRGKNHAEGDDDTRT